MQEYQQIFITQLLVTFGTFWSVANGVALGSRDPSQFMLGLYNLSFIDIVIFIVGKSNSQRGIDVVNSFALL